VEFVQYLISHCNKQENFLSSIKCVDAGCFRCRSFGIDKSGKLIEIVRSKFSNKFPIMKIDGEHCPTLDDMLNMNVICNNQLSGSCDEHNYQFSSHKDQQRHWILCHGGVPTASYVKGQFRCNFQLENESKCNGFSQKKRKSYKA
jgi:hypothetical protein